MDGWMLNDLTCQLWQQAEFVLLQVRMSWAVSEWKDGLPVRALQKIEEIEKQLDRLNKERQQKQFQMDSLQQVWEI